MLNLRGDLKPMSNTTALMFPALYLLEAGSCGQPHLLLNFHVCSAPIFPMATSSPCFPTPTFPVPCPSMPAFLAVHLPHPVFPMPIFLPLPDSIHHIFLSSFPPHLCSLPCLAEHAALSRENVAPACFPPEPSEEARSPGCRLI